MRSDVEDKTKDFVRNIWRFSSRYFLFLPKKRFDIMSLHGFIEKLRSIMLCVSIRKYSFSYLLHDENIKVYTRFRMHFNRMQKSLYYF